MSTLFIKEYVLQQIYIDVGQMGAVATAVGVPDSQATTESVP